MADNIVRIENEFLCVEVNLFGGNLWSIVDRECDEQLLWQGEERSWHGRDVVIFPFVGRLLDGEYTDGGTTYAMRAHGLLRYDTLTESAHTANSVALTYRSTPLTKQAYPFDFHFTVTYTLDAKKLRVDYEIANTGLKIMAFGLGGHPALRLPHTEHEDYTDISGNTITFHAPFQAELFPTDESGKYMLPAIPIGEISSLALSKGMFQTHATWILRGAPQTVTLERSDGRRIAMHTDSPYFALWSPVPFGGFVCMEPWWSLPDFVGAPRELLQKDTLIHLQPSHVFRSGYQLQF